MQLCNVVKPFLKFCVLFAIATIALADSQSFAQINDPRDIPGNTLWLDGSDVDGDFVPGGAFLNGTTWVDKSTAQNASATQTLATALPNVVITPANNLTTVQFDGDDFMDVESGAFGMLRNVEGATMIGVLSTELESSNRGLRALMVSSGANSAATRAGINLFDGFGNNIGGTGDFGLAGRRLDSDGFQRIEGGSVVPGQFHTLTGLFDYQAGEVSLLVDGQQETSISTFQTPGLTSDTDSLNIRVGADAALNSPRGFFNGQISELVVYDRVLSASELADLNVYLAEKWQPFEAPLGDINLDGSVNFFDIGPFIAILSAGEFQVVADIDQSGEVDFMDIAPFIAILIG